MPDGLTPMFVPFSDLGPNTRSCLLIRYDLWQASRKMVTSKAIATMHLCLWVRFSGLYFRPFDSWRFATIRKAQNLSMSLWKRFWKMRR